MEHVTFPHCFSQAFYIRSVFKSTETQEGFGKCRLKMSPKLLNTFTLLRIVISWWARDHENIEGCSAMQLSSMPPKESHSRKEPELGRFVNHVASLPALIWRFRNKLLGTGIPLDILDIHWIHWIYNLPSQLFLTFFYQYTWVNKMHFARVGGGGINRPPKNLYQLSCFVHPKQMERKMEEMAEWYNWNNGEITRGKMVWARPPGMSSTWRDIFSRNFPPFLTEYHSVNPPK